MTRTAKVVGCVAAIVLIGAVVLFVTRGGNTPAGRYAVAVAQKLAPPPDSRRAGSSASQIARGTTVPDAPARAAQRPALPPQNVPIAPYLEDLKRRARAGDVAAACRVTFELTRCGMRSGLRELESDLAGLAGGGAAQEQRRAAVIKGYEEQRASLARACEGVSEAAPADLWEYALIAAHGGNVQAMVHFAGAPPGLDNRNMLAQLEGWTAWRDNAAALVTRAVEAGDPAAVQLAGHMHFIPRMGYQVLPRDPVRGLAHYYALKDFAKPGYQPMLDRDIEGFADKFAVTESQRQQAIALSAEIAAKIARGGRAVDGVDFRKGSGNFADALHCEQP